MRKDEITFRGGRASVNIKVPWEPLERSVLQLKREQEIPDTLTEEWIRENVSEERLDGIFWHVCEAELEYFTGWAAEILSGTTFHQDGRSGGWAVSNWDEYDVDQWDAVNVAKWAKIERVAREIAAGVNAQVVLSVYLNEYSADNVYVDAAPVGESIPA